MDNTTKIEELAMSKRTVNLLKKMKIETVGDLKSAPLEDIKAQKGVGVKMKEEITSAWRQAMEGGEGTASGGDGAPAVQGEGGDPVRRFYGQLAGSLRPIIQDNDELFFKGLRKAGIDDKIGDRDISDVSKTDALFLLGSIEVLQEGLKGYMESWIAEHGLYFKESELVDRIKQDMGPEAVQEAVLEYLLAGDMLAKIGGYYVLKRETLDSYLRRAEHSRNMMITMNYLDGDTQQGIADRMKMTKSNVGMIVDKTIRRMPFLMEDYYSVPYRHFSIPKSVFSVAFPDADPRAYQYVSVKYKSGSEKFNAGNIDAYSGLYEEEIGQYKLKHLRVYSKQEIAMEVLKDRPRAYIHYEFLESAYKRFLDSRGLDKERYAPDKRSILACYRSSVNVVFDEKGRFRYHSIDPTPLWGEIDFDRYRDVVMPATRIFDEYRDLMRKYDILSGYELFCLLKNSSQEGMELADRYDITFGRIPTIMFGEGKEDVRYGQAAGEEGLPMAGEAASGTGPAEDTVSQGQAKGAVTAPADADASEDMDEGIHEDAIAMDAGGKDAATMDAIAEEVSAEDVGVVDAGAGEAHGDAAAQDPGSKGTKSSKSSKRVKDSKGTTGPQESEGSQLTVDPVATAAAVPPVPSVGPVADAPGPVPVVQRDHDPEQGTGQKLEQELEQKVDQKADQKAGQVMAPHTAVSHTAGQRDVHRSGQKADLPDRWVDIEDIAYYLSIPVELATELVQSGSLPAYRFGGLYRLKLSEVDEWVRNGRIM